MKYAVIFVCTITVSIGALSAITPADSIRQEMRHLTGDKLLKAHSHICRLASEGDDPEYESRCIDAFLAEAIRQSDVRSEGLARIQKLYYYYNYDMTDSLVQRLPAHLSALRKNKTWDYYYSAWKVLVEQYLYEGKLQTALKEAENICADAHERKSNYGLGIAYYTIGCIYQTMERLREAEDALEESVIALSREEDITEHLSAYNSLCEILDALGKYDKLKKVSDQWKRTLDKYQDKARSKGYAPPLNGRYLYWALAAATVKIESGEYAEAEELLQLAEKYAEGRKSIARCKLLQVRSRYYVAKGLYHQAILCNRENIDIISAVGDSVSLLSIQTQQAALLMKVGHYKEAATLYSSLISCKDAWRDTELSNQLDELRTLFEVDKLRLRNKLSTNLFYFSLIIGLLLLLTLLLYIRYTHRLRQKNRVLYDAIQKKNTSTEKVETPESLIPEEHLDGKERLYRQLCKLMEEEELFKEPQLNRDVLAERLGSNHVYLSEAIRKYGGDITVGEFINRYRLRHAAHLLTNDLELNIGEVEFASGFNSRTTFSRLFRANYGMSPSEYREISKEKKNAVHSSCTSI